MNKKLGLILVKYLCINKGSTPSFVLINNTGLLVKKWKCTPMLNKTRKSIFTTDLSLNKKTTELF
jgi:hypothetical protein